MESLGIGSVCTRATQITHGRLVRARGTPGPNQQIGSSLNLVCARSKTTGSTSSFTAISPILSQKKAISPIIRIPIVVIILKVVQYNACFS